MTKKRDLKRRVRDRQVQTGETYTAARRHVLAQAEHTQAPIAVNEATDLTEAAQPLGYRCTVRMLGEAAADVDPCQVLERLRDGLLATSEDPTTKLLRDVVFEGARPKRKRASLEDQRFLVRLSAGIGGVSDSGQMLTLQVGKHLVLCSLVCRGDEPPWILLTVVRPGESPVRGGLMWRLWF
jgi:hypothetical protein